MNSKQLLEFLQKRKIELSSIVIFWEQFESFHKEVKLKDSTYKDVQSKVSSKMAFLDRSIQDHEKLINNG